MILQSFLSLTSEIILLNNKKFNQINFKDPIGFIEQFMNQAASHLANRKEFCRALEKEEFLKVQRRVDNQEIVSKEGIVSRKVILRGLSGRLSH